jgi:hypothetical protein
MDSLRKSSIEFLSLPREDFMQAKLYVTAAVLVSFAVSGRGQQPKEPAHRENAGMPEAVFKN